MFTTYGKIQSPTPMYRKKKKKEWKVTWARFLLYQSYSMQTFLGKRRYGDCPDGKHCSFLQASSGRLLESADLRVCLSGGGGGGLCVKVCRKERTSVRSPCPHGVASNSLDREDGVGEWQRDRETSWPACSVQFSFLCPSLRLTLAQRFLSFKDATLAIIQGRHLKDGLQFPLTWSQISKDNTFYLPGMKCPPSPSIFSSVNQKLLLPDDREK